MKDEPKNPAERAKQTLEKGLGSLFKAAGSAAKAVKRETEQVAAKGPTIGKALDDAGREVVRAASNVANFLGHELSDLGKKLSPDDEAAIAQRASGSVRVAGSDEPWPKTREEYEKKYGRDGDDWPKSREEYEEKYGRPPRKRGDDDDPGFRIASPK